MSDTPPPQPASWYPNPDGTDTLRYWDGSGWTEHVSAKPVDLPAPPASPEFDPPAPASASPTPHPDSIESVPSEAAGTTDDRGSSVAPPGSPAAPEPAPTPTGPLRAPITKIAPHASVDGRSPRKPQRAFALIGLVIVLAVAVVAVVVVASGSGNNHSQQVAKLIESGGYAGGESNILEANFTDLVGASGAACSASGSLRGRTVYACTWTNDGKAEHGRWEYLSAHDPYPAAIGRVSDGGSTGSAPSTATAATTLVNSVIQQRDPGSGGSETCSGPTKATVLHADGLTLPGGVGGDYVCEILDDGSPVDADDGEALTETWRWASDGVVLEDKDGTATQESTESGNTGNAGDSGSGNSGYGTTGNTGSGNLPRMPSQVAAEYAARANTSNVAGIGSEKCSSGVTISGKNTDCGFADSVEGAYQDAGIEDGNVSATSPDDPSLGSISMRCTVYSGDVVACIGGIDDRAIVFFNRAIGTAERGNTGSGNTGSGNSGTATTGSALATTCGSLTYAGALSSVAETGGDPPSCNFALEIAKQFLESETAGSEGVSGSIGRWSCQSGGYNDQSILDFECGDGGDQIDSVLASGSLTNFATMVTDYFEIGNSISQTDGSCVLQSAEAEVVLTGTLNCPFLGAQPRTIGGVSWTSGLNPPGTGELPGSETCDLGDVDEDADGGGQAVSGDTVIIASIRGSTAQTLCNDLNATEEYVNDGS